MLKCLMCLTSGCHVCNLFCYICFCYLLFCIAIVFILSICLLAKISFLQILHFESLLIVDCSFK